ncbi:MAG TPA: nucleotidyltransferase domain-containing protein [Bryobacteraceae bacterium]|nr:nucleotidyltransferase domain-containing protein [Bryobacteraceae bacterium]
MPWHFDPNKGTIKPRMGLRRNIPGDPIGAALFGATRQAVLGFFFTHIDERFYQRQVLRALRLGSGAVQRDLSRLCKCGILVRTVEGRQTYYQVNRQCPVVDELRGLIRKTFGVSYVLQTNLRALANRIQIAFVYGSLAEGRETPSSDIDVMIVGDHVTLDEIVSAFSTAQAELAREINPSLYRIAEYCRKLSEGHHFLSSVMDGPKMFLIGDETILAGLVQEWVAQRAQGKPAGDRRPPRRR